MKIMNWSGRMLDPFDMKTEDFSDAGIQCAVTLSRVQRFWGQLKEPYTVAQHCLSMVVYFEEMGADGETLRWALAHEVYEGSSGLGDIPSPVKRRMPEVVEAERRALETFAEVYGLSAPMPDEVKRADAGLLVMEAEALMPCTDAFDWRVYGRPVGRLWNLGADPEQVKRAFLLKWQELFGRT